MRFSQRKIQELLNSIQYDHLHLPLVKRFFIFVASLFLFISFILLLFGILTVIPNDEYIKLKASTKSEPPSVVNVLPTEQVRGLWVECEGTNETLSSPEKLNELISIARDTGVNTIFLQIYRHNRSWYNSNLADTAPFKDIWRGYKTDSVAYVITQAHKYGIKVHAWINVFRIGKDLDVPIIQKLGRGAITRDGRGISLVQYPTNKLPDGGYWLDPGDLKVQSYVVKVVEEILQKYPKLDGIHLDYIRYPYIDIAPGSQFSNRKDFGYGPASVERFKSKYGYSPLGMDLRNKNFTQKWDNWRREQVSGFVKAVYILCKKLKPDIQFSCAVQPWPDRAYHVAYQDWHNWLEYSIVDFIVLMNYSIDRELVKQISQQAVANSYKSPIYIGLGAYLLVSSPSVLYQQIRDCQKLKTKGVVLFSYDALLKNRRIFKTLKENNWLVSKKGI